MRFWALLLSGVLLVSAAAIAQDHGKLAVTVQTRPEAPTPPGRAIGAKVVVVHWTQSKLHPEMVQDKVATTGTDGTCTIELPPGTYDIFVTAAGLTPVAVKRDILPGETTPLVVSLKAAPMQLRPVAYLINHRPS